MCRRYERAQKKLIVDFEKHAKTVKVEYGLIQKGAKHNRTSAISHTVTSGVLPEKTSE